MAWDLLVYGGRDEMAGSTEGCGSLRELPFAVVAAGAPAPEAEHAARHENYPVDRLRLLDGLDWLLTVECDVLNLSIGPRGRFRDDDPLQIATREFVRRGKVVVVAAGNYGPEADSMISLARAPWVVSVGAVDAGGRVLATSSRGDRLQDTGPTCSSFGANDFVPGESGTSFSAPRVSSAAAFAAKCLELVVSDVEDVLSENPREWSAPIRMPWIGSADTGWDPVKAPYHWGPVAGSLLPGTGSIEIVKTPPERAWAEKFVEVSALASVPKVDPELVRRTLRLSASPLDGPPENVGFGLVTKDHVESLFRRLLPSTLAAILDIRHLAGQMEDLDVSTGAWWSPDRFAVAADAFGTGFRFSVARVRK